LLWWLKLGCATIGSILAVLCTFLRRLNLCHFFNHRLAHDRGRIFHGAVPWRSGDYEDGDKKQLHRKNLSSFGVTAPILIFSGLVSIPHPGIKPEATCNPKTSAAAGIGSACGR
jgi:hypothetical protein